MQFIEANWYLVLAMVVSGGMLIWPIVQRRLALASASAALEQGSRGVGLSPGHRMR